jgi:hypothetical protein
MACSRLLISGSACNHCLLCIHSQTVSHQSATFKNVTFKYSGSSVGLLNALTEKAVPGAKDLEPDAEAHLLQYIEAASGDVLMQVTAHEASTRGRIFNSMAFVHLEATAKKLKRVMKKFLGSCTLEAATRVMTARLTHRMRYYFKGSSSQDIVLAIRALLYVVALEPPSSVSQEVQEMVTMFTKCLARTSVVQREKITPDLVCSLCMALSSFIQQCKLTSHV